MKEYNIFYDFNKEEIDNGMVIYSKSDMNEKSNISKTYDINNNSINVNSTRTNSRKKNKSDSNSISNPNSFNINENCVKMVIALGFKKEYIVKYLEKNELNQATAAYYLHSNYENIKC